MKTNAFIKGKNNVKFGKIDRMSKNFTKRNAHM